MLYKQQRNLSTWWTNVSLCSILSYISHHSLESLKTNCAVLSIRSLITHITFWSNQYYREKNTPYFTYKSVYYTQSLLIFSFSKRQIQIYNHSMQIQKYTHAYICSSHVVFPSGPISPLSPIIPFSPYIRQEITVIKSVDNRVWILYLISIISIDSISAIHSICSILTIKPIWTHFPRKTIESDASLWSPGPPFTRRSSRTLTPI